MTSSYRFGACVLAATVLWFAAARAEADILNWQTGETIPGTEGIDPGRSVDLSGWNREDHNLRFADLDEMDLPHATFDTSWLDNARFRQSDLHRASFQDTSLTSADFSHAELFSTRISGNLTSANFRGANLENAQFAFGTNIDNADLSDAVIRGANFSGMTSFTAEQLSSTDSYKAKDLRGVQLVFNQIDGWDFSGQDLDLATFDGSSLVGANFREANLSNVLAADTTLTDADFRQATVRNVGFERADLTRADFSGVDLSNSRMFQATLVDANFDDAVINETQLWAVTSRGFTKEQFYSTASGLSTGFA